MTREEKLIHSKIGRRGFMSSGVTAAGTLAALSGREVAMAQTPRLPATADSIIVLWMAGGMAAPDTFDTGNLFTQTSDARCLCKPGQ